MQYFLICQLKGIQLEMENFFLFKIAIGMNGELLQMKSLAKKSNREREWSSKMSKWN